MWVSRKRYAALLDKLNSIENQVIALKKAKNLDSASYELREFLADIMEHGCGIVKIAPDSIFIRGLKQ